MIVSSVKSDYTRIQPEAVVEAFKKRGLTLCSAFYIRPPGDRIEYACAIGVLALEAAERSGGTVNDQNAPLFLGYAVRPSGGSRYYYLTGFNCGFADCARVKISGNPAFQEDFDAGHADGYNTRMAVQEHIGTINDSWASLLQACV